MSVKVKSEVRSGLHGKRPDVGSVLLKAGVVVLSTLVAACGGGGGGGSRTTTPPPTAAPPPAADCSIDAEKDFVVEVANDWYKWYDEMADVDPADFDTPSALLRALTAPLADDFRDPGFSFLTTVAQDEANFTSGAFVGFGFRFAVTEDGRYMISDVFEGSAAFDGGFVRGAEMLAVDDGGGFQTFREYEEQGATLSQVFGPSEDGVERGFRLLIDGETVEVVIAKRELDEPPLATAPLRIEREGMSPVAYLHLRGFTLTAVPALEEAFAELVDEDVTDFIIDLRYNPGGLLSVSDEFLNLLGGIIAEGEVSVRIAFNDKRSDEDEEALFAIKDESVSPLRIAFITTETSASASELLINSLEPHIEMVLVGSDTSGKAVGQSAFDLTGCETRLRLVTFEFVNGEDEGGFYTGLADTGRFTLWEAEDEFTGAFGTQEEAMTASALAWLNEGACTVNAAGAVSPLSSGIRRGPPPITGEEFPDRRSTWWQ